VRGKKGGGGENQTGGAGRGGEKEGSFVNVEGDKNHTGEAQKVGSYGGGGGEGRNE